MAHPVPVLVLRALGLGDALTGVPALRGLRHRFGDAPIVLAAAGPPASLLADLGVVDAVVPTPGLTGDPPAAGLAVRFGTRRHVAVNLHGRGPQSHRLLRGGLPDELIGFANADAGGHGPQWRPGEHEVVRWCRLVDGAGGRCDPAGLRLPVPPGCSVRLSDHVLIHPGAASGSRRWPPRRWAAVAAALARLGRTVLVTGGPGERALAGQVTVAAGLPDRACVAGTLPLPDLCALVASAALVCSGDTGVAHLATAYAAPSVRLFGPVPPSRWGPVIDTDRHVVLWHGDGTGDPHADSPDPRLLRITVPEVMDAARTLLDRGHADR
ncbi:MAG TPA: glycosyltransferase family 9 protein [Mycobacteriales bacterium]|nr:glycosyltransferase family 9 protein [Mycobacteriales bacterium]